MIDLVYTENQFYKLSPEGWEGEATWGTRGHIGGGGVWEDCVLSRMEGNMQRPKSGGKGMAPQTEEN